MRVVMRGDIFDGRSFVKSSISGSAPDQKQKAQRDLDLDIKMSRVLGHLGEALRSVELKLSRRGGQLRAFTLNATLGRDTPLKGDLRESRDLRDQRSRSGSSQVLYLDTSDAGALFRFTDTYPRMTGGRVWVMMDRAKCRSGAAGRRAEHSRLCDPRRARAGRRATQFSQRAARQYRVYLPQRGIHPHAGQACDPRRRRARPRHRRDDRRRPRLSARRGAPARHIRAALHAQQFIAARSNRRTFSRRRKHQYRRVRRSPTKWSARPGQPIASHKSGVGARARNSPQILRISRQQRDHSSGAAEIWPR